MPQPQEDFVFGFDILKELPIKPSEKSTRDPLSIFSDDLSTTIFYALNHFRQFCCQKRNHI